MNNTIRELTYLKDLTAKYGSHYLGKYFGFTLKDFALKMGITKFNLSMILSGRRNLAKKHEADFIRVFEELQIENKTKDFKESTAQLSMKEAYQKTKFLTTFIVCVIIFTMNVNFLEYICCSVENSRRIVKPFNRAFDFLLNAFFVFSTLSKNIFRLKPTLFKVGFLF